MQYNSIAKHFKSAWHNLPQVFIQDGERYMNAWVSSPQRPPGVLGASVCCHCRRPPGPCRPPSQTGSNCSMATPVKTAVESKVDPVMKARNSSAIKLQHGGTATQRTLPCNGFYKRSRTVPEYHHWERFLITVQPLKNGQRYVSVWLFWHIIKMWLKWRSHLYVDASLSVMLLFVLCGFEEAAAAGHVCRCVNQRIRVYAH